jgi:hypothetical protein
LKTTDGRVTAFFVRPKSLIQTVSDSGKEKKENPAA